MPSDARAARTGPWVPDAGHTPDTRSDAELIAAVRGGDSSAFAALWSRHHPAALRYALQFPPRSNAEDLVSEAFARLLRVLQAGGGPDMNVRPYLLTAVKRLRIDLATRYERRVGLTDDDTDLEVESADPAEAKAMEGLEASLVWKAYSELPERWQLVLWHTLIEEQPAAEVATILGSSPNAIAALSMRAREGLRQAFLQAHVSRSASSACVPVLGRLGAWQRRALSNREAATVSRHLDTCSGCRSAAAEVGRLNQSLRSIVLPLVLGGIASASGFLSDAADPGGSGPSAAAAHGEPHHPRHGAHHSGRTLSARLRAELKPVLLSGGALVVVVGTLTALATMPKQAQRVRVAQAPAGAPTATGGLSTPTVAPPTYTRSDAGSASAPGLSASPTATASPGATGQVGSAGKAAGGAAGAGAAAGATSAPSLPGTSRLVPLPGTGSTAVAAPTGQGGATASSATGGSPSGTDEFTIRPELSGSGAVPSSSAGSTSSTDLPATTRLLPVRVVAGNRDETGSLRVTVPANWQLLSVTGLRGDVCVRVSGQQFDCTVAPSPPPGKHFYTVSAASQLPVIGDQLTADYISRGHLQRRRFELV